MLTKVVNIMTFESWIAHPSLAKIVQWFLPLPTFHMYQYHGNLSDHISKWHFDEHSPNINHVHLQCSIHMSSKLSKYFQSQQHYFKNIN
jgi:hypothetical protein